MLAKYLGSKYLVIVVNKMDQIGWDHDRYQFIKEQVWEYVVKECGFEKGKIQFVPISGLNNHNINSEYEVRLEKNQKTLLGVLDSLPIIERSRENFLRIPVNDKFYFQNNLFVYGKIESGIIHSNMESIIMPQ